MSACDLYINVTPRDVRLMGHTIPHLVRSCRYPFRRRFVVADRSLTVDDSVEQRFDDLCDRLLNDGVIDQVVPVDPAPETVKRIYLEHYGRGLGFVKDFRGGAIYAYLYGLHLSDAPYIVHFDSDMLLHQPEDANWISEGMKVMEKDKRVVIAGPHPGPPVPPGEIKQRGTPFEWDDRGYYLFQQFTSRRFLLHRERYRCLLPLKAAAVSRRYWIKGLLNRRSALQSWENSVSAALCAHGHYRADLGPEHAWTLHPREHTSQFINSLPEIVKRVEAGEWPAGQEGDYDLRMDLWTCSR